MFGHFEFLLAGGDFFLPAVEDVVFGAVEGVGHEGAHELGDGILGVRGAVLGVSGNHAVDPLGEGFGNLLVVALDGDGIDAEVAGADDDGVGVREGDGAGEHVVADLAQAVEVGAGIEGVVEELFRGDVVNRADGEFVLTLAADFIGKAGEAEVEDFDGEVRLGVALEHEVGGLDIEVEDVAAVGGGEAFEALEGDLVEGFEGDFAVAEEGGEGVALDEFEGEVTAEFVVAEIGDADDVAVEEVGEEAGLTLGLFDDVFGEGDVGAEAFESDPERIGLVEGEVNLTEAAGAEESLDLVTSPDDVARFVQGHGGRA